MASQGINFEDLQGSGLLSGKKGLKLGSYCLDLISKGILHGRNLLEGAPIVHSLHLLKLLMDPVQLQSKHSFDLVGRELSEGVLNMHLGEY